MDNSDAVSHGENEEDDDNEYEESDGGNRLLGFMFGNVDNAGDLDVDYLDEDAKEHFAALASKLGPSLADIDLTKSPSTSASACEHDYDEKAEDAIDYEDIEEQYEGPEVLVPTEEDHLLSKEGYFSSDVSLDLLNHKTSIFDEENYDEDENAREEIELEKNNTGNKEFPPEGHQIEISHKKMESPDENLPSAESSEAGCISSSEEDIQGESGTVQEHTDSESGVSLPILCVEDGMVILRFSEIFGIHEPLKKSERKDSHRLSKTDDFAKSMNLTYSIEEDEATYMKSSHYDPLITTSLSLLQDKQMQPIESDAETTTSGFRGQRNDTCFSAEPMKEAISVDKSVDWMSPLSPKFYPLDQQNWENDIFWGNSPPQSSGPTESFLVSGSDTECFVDVEADGWNLSSTGQVLEIQANGPSNDHHSEEAFDSTFAKELAVLLPLEKSHHPQMLRLESSLGNEGLDDAEMQQKTGNEKFNEKRLMRRFSKISLQNKNLTEGSWLNHIIWDPIKSFPKPKLIFDLQDDQMLFELLDDNYLGDLQSHSGAMIISHFPKSSSGDSLDHSSSCGASAGRFNISNDKYYSNRKNSQQLKASAKKRSIYGLRVMHSAPALRLQTMKPKLSIKEVANFHRPKALWYPRDNKVSVKLQEEPCTSGLFKIILKTLGGKLTLLRVAAEETVSSVFVKASKKLDFGLEEKIEMFYMGKKLEDDKTLVSQNVHPNSILYLLRTKIFCWPMAQKLPDENKPFNPPGAFKKKSDLSVKDGHVFMVEYCEERPLLLGNPGMGAKLCTYYQKLAPGDHTASTLRSVGPGNIIALEQTDKTPFLGDIGAGCSQSSLETNMYRAPIFPHELPKTDYLLVRSAKGMLSLRRIDKIYAAGQQEPHMEVMSPGMKSVQNYLLNRLMVYVHREFRAKEKPGFLPFIQADELSSQFSNLGETFIRKRMKTCADLQRDSKGHLFWVMRRNFRICNEEELRKMVVPENVCSYESMQAGLHRLKSLGIKNLTHPVGLSAAMNRLPDEAIALAAASHIERELQITPWNLSSNFVACTHQNRENIERLEITGVGDPSGRGLGFSYVRAAPKATGTSSSAKKKAPAARGGSTVTGTDADLRRLSMDAAREVLLKFNVPEENIAKMTRWHRIAMIRKLSSEQAESGIKVDTATLSKFARGQRMSFVQLQQQAREKCQEIWDRQVQSLSAADDDDDNDVDGTDSEANSDLDSFAGDLENLLDAEEFEDGEEGNVEFKNDKSDGVRGLKMRRCPSQSQTKEEIEEDEEDVAAIHRLLHGHETDMKRKKVKKAPQSESQLNSSHAELIKRPRVFLGQAINSPKLDATFSSKEIMQQIKEKKPLDKPVRENFVCGACGMLGHMRTNKNCPKRHGEELDASELETMSSKSHPPDVSAHHSLKIPNRKLVSKTMNKTIMPEGPEISEKSGVKNMSRIHSLKLKCGPPSNNEKNQPGVQCSTHASELAPDTETESKPTGRINKIIISSKARSENIQSELQKPSVVIRLPVEADKDKPRKKVIIKQPRTSNVERDSQPLDAGVDEDFRKTKKIAELAGFVEDKLHNQWITEETPKKEATKNQRFQDEEKRRSKLRIAEERRRNFEVGMRIQEEQQRLHEIRLYEEAQRKEIEEQARAKKKKKKKKHDFRDEYMDEYRSSSKDWRMAERDRAVRKRPMAGLGRHTTEYGPPSKRRRGGEVILSNILESIADKLRETTNVSYLFLRPVTKKEAPDYFDIIKQPMDLSTIKDKVRRMEYKNKDDFRHDVWQITYNAHKYNDGRNPGIPPLADQLLEICDYLLDVNQDELAEAEASITQ